MIAMMIFGSKTKESMEGSSDVREEEAEADDGGCSERDKEKHGTQRVRRRVGRRIIVRVV